MDFGSYIQYLVYMNRYLTFFLAALMLLASCQKPPTVITDLSPEYSGRMTVVYEGEDFVQNGISVKAELSEDGKKIDLMLEKVKFVPAMPIRIDVTIMDIPLEEAADGSLLFSADGVVPWAMGGPYDTYRVDGLAGSIKGDEIVFSLDFFNVKKNEGYPTSYSGRKVTK